MKLHSLLFLGVVASMPTYAQTSNTVQDVFAPCAACHVNGGIGPSLKGVYGRKAGSLAGFTYSRAMRNAGLTWDDKALDAFIADPQKAIPGTVMPFSGVPDAKQRAEIIGYLRDQQ